MAKLVLEGGSDLREGARLDVHPVLRPGRVQVFPSPGSAERLDTLARNYVSLVPDVTSTGAVGRVAEPPVGQVPSGIAESTPGVTTGENKQLGKAEELLRVGDIVGARWVLEHALPRGNPLVAFKLAETYDAHAWL